VFVAQMDVDGLIGAVVCGSVLGICGWYLRAQSGSKKQHNIDMFSFLPDDLLCEIFKRIALKHDICNILRVCKRWNKINKERDMIWMWRCIIHPFGKDFSQIPPTPNHKQETSWKLTYVNMLSKLNGRCRKRRKTQATWTNSLRWLGSTPFTGLR
jgi:hypothetical protein